MLGWREKISSFLWLMRNAHYQRRLATDAEHYQRSADYLERTENGAGDRSNYHM